MPWRGYGRPTHPQAKRGRVGRMESVETAQGRASNDLDSIGALADGGLPAL